MKKQVRSRRVFFFNHFKALFFPMLGVILVMLALTGTIIVANGNAELAQHLDTSIQLTQQNFDLILSNMDMQRQILNQSTMRETAYRTFNTLRVSYDDNQMLQVLQRVIQLPLATQQYVHSLYVYFNNPEGRFYSSDRGLAQLSTYSDASWYDCLPQMQQYETELFPRTIDTYQGELKLISVIQRLYRGALVLNIRGDYFDRVVSEGGQECETVLLGVQGDVVATTLDEANTQAVLELYGQGRTKDAVRLLAVSQSAEYGYTLIQMVSSKNVYLLTQNVLAAALWVTLGVVVFSAVIAYLMSKKNYQQLMTIVEIFERGEENDSLNEMDLDDRDQYTFLLNNITRAFVMQNQLRLQLVNQRYEQTATELKAMQYQINPHFVFNVLQALRLELYKQVGVHNSCDPVLDHFSQLMRYALQSADAPVTLDEEIEALRHYVAIQRFRYNNSFDVLWDYDENVGRCYIQRLLLQPLAENSIVHGLCKLEDKRGLLKIRARYKPQEGLEIKVMDNGCGMSEEMTAQLNGTPSCDLSAHIGFMNTKKRIALRYGAAGSIYAASIEGMGTVVTLHIPDWDKTVPPPQT